MSYKELILGIDTSNYTTSVAILSLDGELIANLKRPLPVKEGERGLRQSDAVFAHTVNIPDIMKEAEGYIAHNKVVAIGVSEKPRNCEGSYMPCFLSGLAIANSLSSVMEIPCYNFSHQCGHIMAAIYSSGREDLLSDKFYAFHISGGTTELVLVTPSASGFKTEILGGTADLNAGQVIDRVGVYMGLSFPAGPEMERLGLMNEKKIPKKKISSKGTEVNLSGLENLAINLFRETGDKAQVSAFVFDYVGRAIASMIDAVFSEHGVLPLVCAGGVMSNSIIKSRLLENYDIAFAEPKLSSDNAVGIAELTRRSFIG